MFKEMYMKDATFSFLSDYREWDVGTCSYLLDCILSLEWFFRLTVTYARGIW